MTTEHIASDVILERMVRKESAWHVITDFPQFNTLLPSIEKVLVRELSETDGVSEWFVNLENAPFSWIEKDRFDRENLTTTFESLTGDFEEVRGRWKIENNITGGIIISLEFQYNLGIPVIEEHLGPVLKQKMGRWLDSLLSSIKTKLEQDPLEERHLARTYLGNHHAITINGKSIRATILNVSPGGMMIQYDDKLDLLQAKVKVNGSTIDSAIVLEDVKQKTYRIIFDRVLSQEETVKIITILSHETQQVQEAMILEHGYTVPEEETVSTEDLVSAK